MPSLRRYLVVASAAILATACHWHPIGPDLVRVTSQCLPPGPGATNLISFARATVASKQTDGAALRDSLGLAGVEPASVVLIGDASTCAKAASAVDKLAFIPDSHRLVYVVQAGANRYFVVDPMGTAGEHLVVALFDSQFKLVQLLLE